MGFKEDLEKGAVGVNGDVKLPLLRKEHGKEYYRRSHKKGKGKSSEAFQGSVATALFCTAVVAMGPLQFGFCILGGSFSSCCCSFIASTSAMWDEDGEKDIYYSQQESCLVVVCRRSGALLFLKFHVFALGMLAAASAAAGVTNLNRTGFRHSDLPNFCKPLHRFCDKAAVSIVFAFTSSLLLGGSAVLDVFWLSKN